MKKFLFLLLASFLVLAACGQEESKSEDKKETKSTDKESKKVDKDSEKDKSDEKESDKKEEKTDDKSNEEVATQDENSEQSQEQVNAEEQQPIQSQEQQTTQDTVQEEPNDQEIQGGTDTFATDEMEEFYQQERVREQENSNALSEQEIQNEINQKANTPEGAEVIRRLGEQGIRTNPPGEAIGN